MKIDANDKEVQAILSLGYFRIPRFQRPYSWEKDEVESFWDDVTADRNQEYFIGSMVVYQQQKPYFGIVDGQQRLTTITLILSAIRNAFKRLSEENLARGIHKYIEQPNINNEQEFIINAETSFPYLQGYIQNFDGCQIDCEVGSEEQNLSAAFELINSKLYSLLEQDHADTGQYELSFSTNEAKINTLKSLRDKILSLKLVFIQLDKEEDAYLIFETLNARGRDLNTSDLVKNLLLKKLKSNSFSLDTAKESWNALIKKFDDINEPNIIENFLLHYWISEHGYTTDKKLFSEISCYVDKNEANASLLLKTLNEAASIYCMVLSPHETQWTREQRDVKDSLTALRTFKVKQQTPMLLALLRAYRAKNISIKILKSVLKKIEYFHFVFNAITSQRSSGSIATLYSSHAIQLTAASNSAQASKVVNSLYQSLSAKLPTYEEFKVKFCELCYLSNKTKYKNIIRYALEKNLGDRSNGLDINHMSMTIEHIFPEAVIREGVDESLVGNIGNLMLIDAKSNSELLRDKLPEQKFDDLKAAGYPLNQVLLDCHEWTEEKVRKRAEDMSRLLYDSVTL